MGGGKGKRVKRRDIIGCRKGHWGEECREGGRGGSEGGRGVVKEKRHVYT